MHESYYKYHIFFCTNLRMHDAPCCGRHQADEARTHAKNQIKALANDLSGTVRVNSAGCLDRCGNGPVLVIYPEGIWYTYTSLADIDEIINEHIMHGRVVERLQITECRDQ